MTRDPFQSRQLPRAEAEAFLAKLKTAGARIDMTKALALAAADVIKQHKAPIIGALIGGAASSGLEYKLHKKDESGTSLGQRLTASASDSLEQYQEETRKKRELTLPEDVAGLVARTGKDTANVLTRHPRSAVFTAAMVGGSAGAKYLAQLVNKLMP